MLLGAITASPSLSESSRSAAFEFLARLLEEEQRGRLVSDLELLPEILSGVGYALSRSDRVYFSRLVSGLLELWGIEGLAPTLSHALMVLKLFEWVVAVFVNSRDLDRIELLCKEFSVEKCKMRNYTWFIMAVTSAGVLRVFRRVPTSDKLALSSQMVNSLEHSISFVSSQAVSITRHHGNGGHLLLQCIAMGLARCGPISFHPHVFLSLYLALTNEIFPLVHLLKKFIEDLSENSLKVVTDKAREVSDSVLFKEAGEITAVFCNQYAWADEGNRAIVEKFIWEYSLELYCHLRKTVLLLHGKNDRLFGDIDRIAEDTFLMIVVFAAEVAKKKLNSKTSNSFRPEVSVRILVSFSCIEYLRRVRLPNYTDAVRQAVLTIQDSESACTSFVESMPSYVELTEPQGLNCVDKNRYMWAEDDVQSARIFFYLRVLPTCIARIPASLFFKVVAPTMFLYMQHPNTKVARASHSVFASFMSSGENFTHENGESLKEQLVFYYVQRALEAYPGITPYEGLSSGVTALVRHVPAGSPALFFCVHSLVVKAQDIYTRAIIQDANLWKNAGGDAETREKMTELLLRLISLVDIQVFPYTLQQLSEFILDLPQEGQNKLLAQLYSLVASSDDAIRKPVLVSWIQSLSYLCSRANPSRLKGAPTASSSISSPTSSRL